MKFPKRGNDLLQWAAEHRICSPVLISGDADPWDHSVAIDYLERVESSIRSTDEATLRQAVARYIEIWAMFFYLEDSLDPKGNLPDRVLNEIANRYPQFRGCADRYRRNSAEVPDYGAMFLNRAYTDRLQDSIPADSFFAWSDSRLRRIIAYWAAPQRSRTGPPPPFQVWYSTALTYAVPTEELGYQAGFVRVRKQTGLMALLEDALHRAPRWLDIAPEDTLPPDVPIAQSPPEAAGDTQSKSERRMAVVMPRLKELGFSKETWAGEADVDRRTVVDYLKGRTEPRPETRKKMAEALGWTPSVLP